MIEDLFLIKGNLRVYNRGETNQNSFLVSFYWGSTFGEEKKEEEEEEEEEEGKEKKAKKFRYGIMCIWISRILVWRLVPPCFRVLVERSL